MWDNEDILGQNIQNYISQCFSWENKIPSDDDIYLKFEKHEPSVELVQKEIDFFFDSNQILHDTVIEWEGDINAGIERAENSVGLYQERKEAPGA
jgi:hypothetical protein